MFACFPFFRSRHIRADTLASRLVVADDVSKPSPHAPAHSAAWATDTPFASPLPFVVVDAADKGTVSSGVVSECVEREGWG